MAVFSVPLVPGGLFQTHLGSPQGLLGETWGVSPEGISFSQALSQQKSCGLPLLGHSEPLGWCKRSQQALALRHWGPACPLPSSHHTEAPTTSRSCVQPTHTAWVLGPRPGTREVSGSHDGPPRPGRGAHLSRGDCSLELCSLRCGIPFQCTW